MTDMTDKRVQEQPGEAPVRWVDHCDLCGQPAPFVELVARDPRTDAELASLGVTGSAYTTVACRNCGWTFKPGVLSDEQLTRLYAQRGGEHVVSTELAGHDRRADELFQFLRRHLNLDSPRRVLDIGGGIGHVSRVLAEHGHRVTVVDMSGGAPVHPTIEIRRTTVDRLGSEKSYDLAIMNHILEHVWSPTELLERAIAVVRPGGHLYIEVPFELYTPMVKRKLGDSCHVGYFSMTTLRQFIAKLGLVPVSVQRVLGRYDVRRVMILRALVGVPEAPRKQTTALMGRGWRSVALEMIYPAQLLIMVRFIVLRWIARLARR